MSNKGLKYSHYSIAFQEVPDEVSLVFNITGCPHKCEGCHSQYLAEDYGRYLEDDIDEIIEKYNGMITCVCFMGGDQDMDSLERLLAKTVGVYHLKTCVYSGLDDSSYFESLVSTKLINYLKIGSYKKAHGGLDKKTTNQVFYTVQCSNILSYGLNGEKRIYRTVFEDITYKFQKEKT